MKDKITELGIKYLNLKKEIAQNQKILRDYENDIFSLMKESGLDTISSRGVKVERVKTESEKFNGPEFKKTEPDKYESYRTTSKRFNQNKLKKEDRETYDKYVKKESSEYLKIEPVEKELDSL